MGELTLSDKEVRNAFRIARKNWADWRDVFQHPGSISNNPLLADPTRFTLFCKEYSVGRTIRKGERDSLRRALAGDKFSRCIQDDTGCSLDKTEKPLRSRFGTHDGTRSMVSVLSKVAAFLRPEQFVAWDRYGKRGLNIVLGRSPNSPFESYARYLSDFDSTWRGQLGGQIRNYARRNEKSSAVEKERRFQRRVLDVALMKYGGRWSTKAGQHEL